MSSGDHVTWVMQPGALAPSPEDPLGTTYGLAIATDSRFQVHRCEPGARPAVTEHDDLAGALDLLPAGVAAFLQARGRIMVDWALEVHTGLRHPPVAVAAPLLGHRSAGRPPEGATDDGTGRRHR